MAVPITDASTTTEKLRVLKLRRITSSAKKTPAIGVWKVAATPAAAPAASRRVTVSGESRSACPTAEPTEAPI